MSAYCVPKFIYLTEAHWGLRFEQSLQVLFLRSSRFESSDRIFLAATWSAISDGKEMLTMCKMEKGVLCPLKAAHKSRYHNDDETSSNVSNFHNGDSLVSGSMAHICTCKS